MIVFIAVASMFSFCAAFMVFQAGAAAMLPDAHWMQIVIPLVSGLVFWLFVVIGAYEEGRKKREQSTESSTADR